MKRRKYVLKNMCKLRQKLKVEKKKKDTKLSES